MVIIGTASNSQINGAINFVKNKFSDKKITLFIKRDRDFTANIKELEVTRVEFDDDRVVLGSFKDNKEKLKDKYTIVVQNTINPLEYLFVYLEILRYTRILYAYQSDGVYRRITVLYGIRLFFAFLLTKTETFFFVYLPVRIIALLPFKIMRKKWLSTYALVFNTFLKGIGSKSRKEILFKELSKLKLINNKKQKSKSVLIVSLSGIGNSIHLFPITERLKRYDEDCKISILVDKGRNTRDIWECNSRVDNIIETDIANQSVLKNFLLLLKIKRYDYTVFGYVSYGDIAIFISFIAGSYINYTYSFVNSKILNFYNVEKVDYNPAVHEVENNIRLIESIINNNDIVYPDIYFSNAVKKRVNNLIEKLNLKSRVFAFHAGSLNEKKFLKKRWPPEKFALLAEILSEKFDTKILLLGSCQEMEANEKIMDIAGKYCYDLTDNLSLKETVALIKRVSLFITNDSGLMHIANLVNTPLIALFGPTNLIKNRPYGMKNGVIIKADVDCAPCQNGMGEFIKDCDDYKCMRAIKVDEVIKQVNKIIIR